VAKTTSGLFGTHGGRPGVRQKGRGGQSSARRNFEVELLIARMSGRPGKARSRAPHSGRIC